MKEMKSESFDERTIIISDFPSFITDQDLVNMFYEFGAITNIELPTVDSTVQK